MTAPTGGLSSHMQQSRSMLQVPHSGQPLHSEARHGEYSSPASRTPEGFATGYTQQAQFQELLPRTRTDYSPNHIYERMPTINRRIERPFLEAPLSLRSASSIIPMPEPLLYRDRASTDSPTRQLYSMPSLEASLQSYPSLRPEPKSHEDLTSSPRTERLPSFQQLSQIADGATDANEQRTTPLPSLTSYAPPSMVSQTSNPYFPASQQSSPSTGYLSLHHQSPAGARSESNDNPVIRRAPATYPGPNQYIQRTHSFTGDKTPAFITSLTSQSSNETNLSHQSSGNDGYSTTNTTPIESASSIDGTPKPMLPLPPGMQHLPSAPGIFTCDYPGCTAAPFQTQYLLNSHANVHSSSRPHYCPVKGCPRSEGGKGFKRKNEMIRHGLVHDSPGYICPFCPLREHKYPRPDNLQRHVRVHHVDKDKDDPLLREVLAQRPEGGSRGRRRRTGP